MWYLSLFIALWFQTAAPVGRVVVGLTNGQQVVVENPEFSGFIQGRNTDAVLMYRHEKFHGQMPASSISRIEFGEYRRGQPFALTVTLKNGQKLEVQSESRDFVTLTGKTDAGTVMIRHPDPISVFRGLKKLPPDRAKDLTIQYLEFPASTE